MLYQQSHIRKLHHELGQRIDALHLAIPYNRHKRPTDNVEIDGTEVRLAVDDFKSILAEIRRLK